MQNSEIPALMFVIVFLVIQLNFNFGKMLTFLIVKVVTYYYVIGKSFYFIEPGGITK